MAAEEYQGIERDVVFVARSDRRLWEHCAAMFRKRWAHAKPSRRPASMHHNGSYGWWFPKIWVRDFLDTHGSGT